jgi:(1->4)-alpha-D-glucan 1-alpha-D-glucosylmutase
MNPEPVATYRLQLRSGFGFDQAAEVVAYLRDLGISHLYLSPYLQAAAGSTHGYDVVNPRQVDRELGGSGAHERMCQTILNAGLGQVADLVPNHMAIVGGDNPWWWDVLENGPASRYARYFDVDWESSDERWMNKVLLPVLGNHFGRILEDGQFQLSYSEGLFVIHYQDQTFPVDPGTLSPLLESAAASCGSETLAFLGQGYARLPRTSVTNRQSVERRHRDKGVLANLLARLCLENPEVAAAVDAQVTCINHDPDAMESLLIQQNYRLAFWRMGSRALGYRRFFDVTELAGLKVEDPDVFQDVHVLPVSWVEQGWVHGLRIDHPDGLRDPSEYFHRLREACPDAWILAEKILETGEKLPRDWPIDGTTGYDFLNLAGGLFVNPENEKKMTQIYETFIGKTVTIVDLMNECKRLVLTELLVSELNRLTSLFESICEAHRRHRDYTRYELLEALRETAVAFPVYRSYVTFPTGTISRQDENYIAQAVEKAMIQRPDVDPDLFRFLNELLMLRIPGSLERELAARFQQLTGPAMAKGVEDTVFYRYNRLVALNEVGGDPSRFGVYPREFHEACTHTLSTHPLTLLASTTHDTKRSEDVRARLAVLSEMPARWEETVTGWAQHNERYRSAKVPDRNTEYLFYQTVVGAWPIDEERITAYMVKAVRESKLHTSWTEQNQNYENALISFIKATLNDETFRAELTDFVSDLLLPGRINSLSQTLLKLTAPGVPDIYQGTELWDLSLVDPDNRRPVDFDLRRTQLEEVSHLSPEEIMARMDEGLPKLWVIRQALHLRHRRPDLFSPLSHYRPIYAQGIRAHHAVAFLRGEKVFSLVQRFPYQFDGDWADTTVDLPAGQWINLLTGDHLPGGRVRLQELLNHFPVGLFLQEGE